MTNKQQKKIRRRHTRRVKMHKLQERLAATKDPQERAHLIEKIRRVTPWFKLPRA